MIISSSVLLCATVALSDPTTPSNVNEIYGSLASKRFVDLTHTFGPKTPHWKGFGEETVTTLYTIKKDGFVTYQVTIKPNSEETHFSFRLQPTS